MAKETIAYCYASGQIEFGSELPAGAIELARGKEKLVRQYITAIACVSRDDNKTLLVPGIPEAENEKQAFVALAVHLRWLKRRQCKGFTVATKEGAL